MIADTSLIIPLFPQRYTASLSTEAIRSSTNRVTRPVCPFQLPSGRDRVVRKLKFAWRRASVSSSS